MAQPGPTASAVDEIRHLLTIPNSTAPNATNNNPVAVAHAALERLRESGDENYLFLRVVIELAAVSGNNALHKQPQNEELFFHCVTGCRQVCLGQWAAASSHGESSSSRNFLERVRDYFMMLGHSLAHSRTCRLACYSTAVSLWKRGWNESAAPVGSSVSCSDAKEEILLASMASSIACPTIGTKEDLFAFLGSLFQQELHQAALFTDCLVNEFGGKSSVSYRLPLEFHKKAHLSFEKEGALQQCLKLCLASLSQLVGAVVQSNTESVSAETSTALGAMIQLVTSIIGWNFGATTAWDPSNAGALSTCALIKPPQAWSEFLGRTDLCEAMFRVHDIISQQQVIRQYDESRATLAHKLRHLLMQLASVSGPVFTEERQRMQYASVVCEGTLKLLYTSTSPIIEDRPDLLDALQILSRLFSNFKVAVLLDIPNFDPLLRGLASTGTTLLADHVNECQNAGGDIDSMENFDWREEILALLLECAVLLCGDHWLLYAGNEETRKNAQTALATVLGPLFEGFVRCRTRMAALEEHYLVTNEADLDEIREEIMEKGLEEEMESISTIGRLHLGAAISCLSSIFGVTMPKLQALWNGSGDVTPEASALLEEARLLTMYVAHLLTDSNEGESPSIPDFITVACHKDEKLTGEMTSAIQALLQFADSQMQKIAKDPLNRRLSPLLAKTFLWFLNRWVPAYIFAIDYTESHTSNILIREWSSEEKASHVITFCTSLCLHYQCYWPQEKPVQTAVGKLLLSLARRSGKLRSIMVSSPVFCEMVRFHCLTAGIRHSAPQTEFESTLRQRVGEGSLPSLNMAWGYQRLPYEDKAHVLTAILVACSDTNNAAANTLINDSLKAVHESFTQLVNAISTRQIDSSDINAREMACLCLEMFCGVACSSEMSSPERIPQLVSGYLPQLSGLMHYYSKDLMVCESLLRFFRDYTCHFIEVLDRDQSIALFQSCTALLKEYSANHCTARVIKPKSQTEADSEEDQSYNDVLCVIQLLINLGAKDFIDSCGSDQGVDSAQVTDTIFFGLQQILPLMTQGLLQFPALCALFFELVGFMMDTYPEKVSILPAELFESLLESLLFGMSHHDAMVSRCSLHGLASITREHISTGSLRHHLTQRPDLFDKCSKRLLSEVVFQSIVVDRMEAAAMALLPLAAVDVNRFAAVVQELTFQLSDPQQKVRLEAAFSNLIQPDVLLKVPTTGCEGRMNRVRFKRDFERFVNTIHAFLVIR